MGTNDKYKKIIMDVFDRVITTEYLYICDDELFNRNTYIEEVTTKQEEMAEEFRKSFADSIKEYEDRGDIKLEEDFYAALNKNGEEFIDKINKALVELAQRQATIKSSASVNLDLEVELDSKKEEDLPKIFKIVVESGSMSLEELKNKYLDRVLKKASNLTEIEKQECIKSAKNFIESL